MPTEHISAPSLVECSSGITFTMNAQEMMPVSFLIYSLTIFKQKEPKRSVEKWREAVESFEYLNQWIENNVGKIIETLSRFKWDAEFGVERVEKESRARQIWRERGHGQQMKRQKIHVDQKKCDADIRREWPQLLLAFNLVEWFRETLTAGVESVRVSTRWRFWRQCFWSRSKFPRSSWSGLHSTTTWAVCTLPFPT